MAPLAGSRAAPVSYSDVVVGVNDVEANAAAYPNRHENFRMVAATGREGRDWLWGGWDALAPYFDGLYLSFERDTRAERVLDAFPAPTLNRLARLQEAYHPDSRFDQNFGIGRSARLADQVRQG